MTNPLPLGNDNDSTLPQKIAQAVLMTYENQIPVSLHPRQGEEWTILAGMVAVVDQRDVIPLSIATGTKCCGGVDDMGNKGYVVHDMHAEVLARRGMVRFLMVEAMRVMQKKEESKFIEYDAHTRCFQWRQRNVSLYLYVSDTPCGTASEYERVGEQSARISGAKGINTTTTTTTNMLRTKPGRSDLPPSKLTRSMSCGDKLTRWASLGIGGGLLSNIFTGPIPLNGIVLGRGAFLAALENPSIPHDFTKEEIAQVLGSTTMSVARRITTTGATSEFHVLPELTVTFPHARQLVDPVMGSEDVALQNKRMKTDSTTTIHAQPISISWIMNGSPVRKPGIRGLGSFCVLSPRGVKSGSALSADGDKSAVDLCKRRMFDTFVGLVEMIRGVEEGNKFRAMTYAQAKLNEPRYRMARDGFFAHDEFKGWVVSGGLDSPFDGFRLG